MKNNGLTLVEPDILPELDPAFRPAALTNRRYCEKVETAAQKERLNLAIEQADGSVFHYSTSVLPSDHPEAEGNFIFTERLMKFLLWSRGGFRVHFDGPLALCKELQAHYKHNPAGMFDAEMMGGRIYEKPFEIKWTNELPPEKSISSPLGRNLDGCRIGFDLGGSDRKVAAVMDGECVFSEEVVWDPVPQKDPQYHYDGIMDSLQRAARRLPRVDAIGGSAAGVYVNNQVKVASLFRGVPPDIYAERVKPIFLKLREAWNGIPFEVANDGEVTALAGSMSLKANAVLGLAMGTSVAGGYVTPEGNITTWLNELAFVPVDYNPDAAVDEWSGDYGCSVQYFSQQGVARLIPRSGLEINPALSPAEKLKLVQAAMAQGDPRAARLYSTIGACLGYTLAHFADFYKFDHLLLLGRVTTGEGGGIIVRQAQNVLAKQFPDLAGKIQIHLPGETERRHGQAIAAASLPAITKST